MDPRWLWLALALSVFCRSAEGCTNSTDCSNRGSCVSRACVCNIGFSGTDCSYESYRPHQFINVPTAGTLVRLKAVTLGGEGNADQNDPVLRFDMVLKLTSYNTSNAIFFMGDTDTDNILSLSINATGYLLFRSSCYSPSGSPQNIETNALMSANPVPTDEWTSISITLSGVQGRTCLRSADNTLTTMIVNGVNTSTTGMMLPLASKRNINSLGVNVTGSISSFRVWQSAARYGTTGNCLISGLLIECDFNNFDSTKCGTLGGNYNYQANSTVLIDRFKYTMYLWTNEPAYWYFPLYQATARSSLVRAVTQRGISTVYLGNACLSPSEGTCWLTTNRWNVDAVSTFLNQSHAVGISVYATYTDVRSINDVMVHNQLASQGAKAPNGLTIQRFDGIALNFEAFKSDTGSLFIDQVTKAKETATKLNIPLHISVSFAWSQYPAPNGVSHDLIDQSVSILTPGDSVDIQVAWMDHCVAEIRAQPIVDLCRRRGVASFVDLETRQDPVLSNFTWYAQGEAAMWTEVRNTWLLNTPTNRPDGFTLHHYKQAVNTGWPGWPVVGAPGTCTGSFDLCDVCRGTCTLYNRNLTACGDGMCDPLMGEDTRSCPRDCTPYNSQCANTTSSDFICEFSGYAGYAISMAPPGSSIPTNIIIYAVVGVGGVLLIALVVYLGARRRLQILRLRAERGQSHAIATSMTSEKMMKKLEEHSTQKSFESRFVALDTPGASPEVGKKHSKSKTPSVPAPQVNNLIQHNTLMRKSVGGKSSSDTNPASESPTHSRPGTPVRSPSPSMLPRSPSPAPGEMKRQGSGNIERKAGSRSPSPAPHGPFHSLRNGNNSSMDRKELLGRESPSAFRSLRTSGSSSNVERKAPKVGSRERKSSSPPALLAKSGSGSEKSARPLSQLNPARGSSSELPPPSTENPEAPRTSAAESTSTSIPVEPMSETSASPPSSKHNSETNSAAASRSQTPAEQGKETQ